MKIFIHGEPSDCRALKDHLSTYGTFECAENHHGHEIAEVMLPLAPDAAIVISDGAAGMEAAMVIRRLYPTLPLIWFSDDSAFGVQAYRLDAAYFAQKTQLEERLGQALSRAGLIK